MDDPARVSVLERAADVDRDRNRTVELKPAPGAVVEHPREIATADVLADDIGDAVLLARVEDADDMWVLAELAHRLRLAALSGQHRFLNPFGLEHRDRDLALPGLGVAGAIDALAPTASEKVSTR